MGLPFSLPQNFIVAEGAPAQVGTTADVNSRAVSMKLIQKLYIIVNLKTAAAAYQVTPQSDALVAFGSAAVLTQAVPIWYSDDADTDVKLTHASDAVHHHTAADANPKIVIFEIDNANLAAGEKCVRVNIPALAATDYVAVTYIAVPRYSQEGNVNIFVD